MFRLGAYCAAQDAVVSVICVETSLHSTAQLGMESVLHSDFPPNPDEGAGCSRACRGVLVALSAMLSFIVMSCLLFPTLCVVCAEV